MVVPVRVGGVAGFNMSASPKWATLGANSPSSPVAITTFSGFRARWTMPCFVGAGDAGDDAAKMVSAMGSSGCMCRRQPRSDGPSMSSITRPVGPRMSMTLVTAAMFL